MIVTLLLAAMAAQSEPEPAASEPTTIGNYWVLYALDVVPSRGQDPEAAPNEPTGFLTAAQASEAPGYFAVYYAVESGELRFARYYRQQEHHFTLYYHHNGRLAGRRDAIVYTDRFILFDPFGSLRQRVPLSEADRLTQRFRIHLDWGEDGESPRVTRVVVLQDDRVVSQILYPAAGDLFAEVRAGDGQTVLARWHYNPEQSRQLRVTDRFGRLNAVYSSENWPHTTLETEPATSENSAPPGTPAAPTEEAQPMTETAP